MRIFSSSESDRIPADHMIDEKKAVDLFKKLQSADTITWIGQSTTLIKIDGKYDLLAGDTRFTGLMANDIVPQVWLIDVDKLV